MSERKYEHTLDMDELVATASRYEGIISEGQDAVLEGDDSEALSKAIDALEIAREMFFMALPADVRDEFQDALEAEVLTEA